LHLSVGFSVETKFVRGGEINTKAAPLQALGINAPPLKDDDEYYYD
jgi:hypothetical protein